MQRTARAARTAMLTLACASAVWGLWLLTFGGFDVSLFGLRIRSNNPQRVYLLTLASLAGYLLAGGTIPFSRLAPLGRRAAAEVGRHLVWVAGLIALASMLASLAGSTRIAGGSDAYGYVSQADLWLRGDLKVSQPWVDQVPWPAGESTFTPLGYRPVAFDGEKSIVPTYAPGLPMLLALAKRVGGQCAMFVVVPVLSGVAVLATYGLGYRLNARAVGLGAAWLVATSPVVLGSLEPLTDVPVMAAWTTAFYFLLGTSAPSAAASGLMVALAILIRPNLFVLAAPMAGWFAIRPTRAYTPSPSLDRAGSDVTGRGVLLRLISAALFAAGVAMGIGAVALINHHLYGSATTSGYGRLQDQFAWSRVLPNLERYLTWSIDTQTPFVLLGFLSLFIPLRRVWPRVPDRRVFVVLAAFVILLWGMYAAYLEFDSWGYLRFVLPSWPLLMLGTAAIVMAVAHACAQKAIVHTLFGLVVVALGLWTIGIASRLQVYDQRQAARHEAPIGQLVRTHTPENSVVLAFERSGSLRYYAGRITLRYDLLDGEWLDRAVEWLKKRGIGVYAVLDERQAAEAKQRFATQRKAAAFDFPFLTYEPAGTSLFDVSAPPDPNRKPIVIAEAFKDVPGCDPPAPLKPLVLR